ncbi:MAG TPA: DUF1573 domain-containing protein [Thermoguttaceae bacterium]|nr:DUF1573 domain-containing protein [Thermoguttaceae bacterium]
MGRGAPITEQSAPRVVIEQEEHDFGGIDVGVTGRHAFVFSNAGDGPLVLERGRSTCGCCTCACAVRLPEGPIAPGESADVTLEWTSKLYVGPFRQTATIRTNDPDRREVTLRVAGRFKGPVGVVPSMLRLSRVAEGRPAMAEVRVYNYLDEPLAIVGYECADPLTAEHFEVAWERIPAEQARKETEARGGYLLRITVKPGMPRGAFRQRIVLKTNVESVPTVELPIEGVVASDVSIVGWGWSAQTGVLSFGRVKRDRGAERTLMVVARGPHAKQVKLKAVAIVPELLAVDLAETTYSESSAVSQTRLTVRIPPGTPPEAHLGSGEGAPGRIVLETDHPDVPRLEIRVRFAVEQ